MEIKWIYDAEEDYYNTLTYWYKHNGSYTYSEKIMKAVEVLQREIAKNPYFLAKYSEHLGMYRRNFLDNRFVIYYKVIEEAV